MTRDDLAVVSRMFECWGEEDLEGMLECVDPDFEVHAAVDGRMYRGHDGVREYFARWGQGGQRLDAPLQRVAEVGPGCILAVGRVRVMTPGRGLADSPGVWLIQLRDGRMTLARSYSSEREAMDALRATGFVGAAK
jgi:ketosteroid isomerase-like protein